MRNKFRDNKIVIASHNPGKIVEIGDLVKPFGLQVYSASELNLEVPEETGKTFKANAILKAEAAARSTLMPAISDDSGLTVDALGGDPGIYSARWAGSRQEFPIAMKKIQLLLGPDSARTAQFVCALAIAWPNGPTKTFKGIVEGTLVWPPRGTRGFGYDAMFLPIGCQKTFGEMCPKAKHSRSHRAKAFEKLIASYFT